ncbi:myb-like DNA-binding protein bas1 [Fusarium chlamydosporum]
MDTEMSHDQIGSNFLDSAFFDTFAGPSPSPLRESEASEDTETPNDTVVSTTPGSVPNLPSNIPDPVQSDPKHWPQPPRPLQAQPPQNNTSGTFTMPSPSTC